MLNLKSKKKILFIKHKLEWNANDVVDNNKLKDNPCCVVQ